MVKDVVDLEWATVCQKRQRKHDKEDANTHFIRKKVVQFDSYGLTIITINLPGVEVILAAGKTK